MATVRARTFEYGVDLDREGAAHSDRGGSAIPRQDAWTPEHLLLAGLCRCTLTSLGFHAGRAGATIASSASAHGRVTRRESDGRFAFVEITVDLAVSIEPAPEPDALAALLAKAERDCFVGASLTVSPTYRWTVNGDPAPSATGG